MMMELLIIILIVLVIYFQQQLAKKERANTQTKEEANDKIKKKNQVISDLQKEIQKLSIYQPIIDVEAELEIRKEESNKYFAQIRQEASEYVKMEREKGKKLKESAENKIQEAHKISDSIIKKAEKKAKEIAGDAYEAKNNAEQYADTARAMENIIKGYGDEYLIPGESLLDELAEEYNHTDAGEDLANVRKIIKSMIKNGVVADCDYVEPSRRMAAIDFVIDAFNGKVDTIMSKVKHDNYGKLLQKLKDAYRLVNYNGKPFKNARVLHKYYDVVEEQLKLAVIVSELKKKDREEQKAIREAIREEDRARRDFEKALKESQKEEKMLAKALQEAEAKMRKANEDEKAKYQQKLEALQLELDSAILKGKRALSMAQQTRMGHVYVISNIGSFGENVFKIGLTRRLEPLDRVKELGDASVPFPFDVHAMIHSEDAPALERELQQYFKDFQINKVNPRKEFFNLSLMDIKSKVEDMELNTHWTMKAEAMEYRESMQLGKAKNYV